MKKIQIMVFFVLLSLFPLQHIAEESVLIQEPISFTESFGNPLYSQVSRARRFTYYASDNDAFKILIERNSGEMWETESISAPLYSWNGINPSLDVIHENMFYIKFDDRAYAEIMHDDSRGWSLRLWAVFSGGSTFFAFYPNALCINKYSAGNASSQWIYGSALISFDLDSLDVSKLPTDDSDILKLIDPSHWAVILGKHGTNEQLVYESPSINGDSVCTLYSGAPVKILSIQAAWANIEVAGLTGWVPLSSLATGREMLSTIQCFPDWIILSDTTTSETCVYSSPSTKSVVCESLQDATIPYIESLRIIGRMDTDWYIVYRPNGTQGFMQTKWFSPGNG